MSEWITCGKKLRDVRDVVLKEGVQFEIRIPGAHPKSKKGTAIHLVGSINHVGGFCDDCRIDLDNVVTRYRVLVSGEALAGK